MDKASLAVHRPVLGSHLHGNSANLAFVGVSTGSYHGTRKLPVRFIEPDLGDGAAALTQRCQRVFQGRRQAAGPSIQATDQLPGTIVLPGGGNTGRRAGGTRARSFASTPARTLPRWSRAAAPGGASDGRASSGSGSSAPTCCYGRSRRSRRSPSPWRSTRPGRPPDPPIANPPRSSWPRGGPWHQPRVAAGVDC